MTARAEHKHAGNIIGPCLTCGLRAWQHRTREGRVQPRIGRKDTRTKRNRPAREHHAARTELRALKTFIGVDGEGVTRDDGTHDYVLLTIGKDSLTNGGERLTWEEIFPFLYECFQKDPYAAYVGYFLGYDFTQWIRTLTQNRAESLWTEHGKARRKRSRCGANNTPFPVYIGDESNKYQWEIDMLGTRRFKIRPGSPVGPMGMRIKNEHKWMHICDAGSFFQQSFLKTLRDFRTVIVKDDDTELREYLDGLEIPIVDGKAQLIKDEEYKLVERGKEKRASAKLDNEMITYNLLECDLLGRIMPLLNIGFRQMGIELAREKWFGPGQAAQAWMTSISAPTGDAFSHKFRKRGSKDECVHHPENKPTCKRTEAMHAPRWARDIGRLTYFGGWFEIFCHGIIPGPSYEYDVNSAYPHEISKLPCLLHGKWEQGDAKTWDDIPKGRTLCAIEGSCIGRAPHVGAMMHRSKNGNVLRPRNTHGWYWLHEIEAAQRAGLLTEFVPKKWVTYEGCNHPAPFSAMRHLYEERLKVGKETPRGKSYKLVYNSSYGKTAQSVGSPKFANGIYASLITCGCRCRLLDAIATHPTKTLDLLMVATDGIYFRTPHPSLELSDTALGLWGMKTKQNMTLFMPGLYWDDKAREALKSDKVELKSRGVPGKDMAKKILETDELFRNFQPGGPWPRVELKIGFSMVTIGQALDRGKWNTCGSVFSDIKRIIDATPKTKREGCYRDGDIIRSDPYQYAPKTPYESFPYDRRFGDELAEKSELSKDVTPDGTALDLLKEELLT